MTFLKGTVSSLNEIDIQGFKSEAVVYL